jgi:prevent-host-death family protein
MKTTRKTRTDKPLGGTNEAERAIAHIKANRNRNKPTTVEEILAWRDEGRERPSTRTIQASAAKAQLLQLLDDVERGETVLITRHGKPIARLVPDEAWRREDARRAMAEIAEMRKHAKPMTVEEIIAAKNEGRP